MHVIAINPMDYDISKPVSQGSYGTQDAENSRIAAIADKLDRLCEIHEAQLRTSQTDVDIFEVEQRAAEKLAKSQGFWIPMMDVFDLGVPGDIVPRNVLVDQEGDIFVIDAEIKHIRL